MTTATRPKILLQTTIPSAADDWHVGRFGLLRDELAQVADVMARDRESGANGDDPVLVGLPDSDVDQVWLIAVDPGTDDTGITAAECAALGEFRRRGGAIFATRDHMDLGASICNLGGIGEAHFFHSKNPLPGGARDDSRNANIDWPNFHSGENGDVQRIAVTAPAHPVFQRADGRTIATLPAHPHEGAVDAPGGATDARVVATGTSAETGRRFNIAVAFEGHDGEGRGWAESTFHHFCDYNWDVAKGCPSFVTDPPSDAIAKNPRLLDDTKTFVRNLAGWLGTRER